MLLCSGAEGVAPRWRVYATRAIGLLQNADVPEPGIFRNFWGQASPGLSVDALPLGEIVNWVLLPEE